MNPITSLIKEREEAFQKEYREAYKNILPDEVLAEGNKWFEEFNRETIHRTLEAVREICKGMKIKKLGCDCRTRTKTGIWRKP